jgi:glycosyltransferase involved in cell wall biosynthesis
MVLVNLAEIVWSPERARNAAIFTALLDRNDLFDDGLYVDPPKVLKSPTSLKERVRRLRASSKLTRIAARATLFRPCFAIPLAMRPLVRRIVALQQANHIFGYLKGRPYCLWVNNIDAPAHELFKVLAGRARAIVLDMSDDWTTFRDAHPERRDARISDVMKKADLMLAVNSTVKGKFAHKNSIVLGNATDFDNFQRRDASFALHDFLPKQPGRKIVGFIGGLNRERVDEPLLDLLISSLKDVLFVFVGYSNDAMLVEKLKRFANVRFQSAVPYADLPFVISAFDVAIVPHLDNEHTQGNDLLKVLDYLATGVPVVSTNCSGVRQKYGEAVTVADSHDDFVAGVRRHLSERHHDSSIGKQIARVRDWKNVVTVVEAALKPLLST